MAAGTVGLGRDPCAVDWRGMRVDRTGLRDLDEGFQESASSLEYMKIR
jgi:hypothetical protein